MKDMNTIGITTTNQREVETFNIINASVTVVLINGKRMDAVIEDTLERMADMVTTIALSSPEMTPSEICLAVKRSVQEEYIGLFSLGCVRERLFLR